MSLDGLHLFSIRVDVVSCSLRSGLLPVQADRILVDGGRAGDLGLGEQLGRDADRLEICDGGLFRVGAPDFDSRFLTVRNREPVADAGSAVSDFAAYRVGNPGDLSIGAVRV